MTKQTSLMGENERAYVPYDKTTIFLRWLCIAYITLIIIEGGLRKWFLPSLSDILLLVRDPIVLAAYALAFATKRFPINKYVTAGLGLVIIWSILTVTIGHKDPIVTAFGIRANYLHLPLAFIMGSVFYRSDVIEIGKWWLVLTIPMTAIIVLQFYSPQSAWINRSIGGGEGFGFGGVFGRARPPGTFSFIVGIVWFYTFSTAFLVCGMTQHQRYPKWLIVASAIATVIAIPVSISRSLILSAGLTAATGLLVSSIQRNAIIRFIRIGLFASIGIVFAGYLPVFSEARSVFLERWEQSTGAERGGVQYAIIWRIANEFIGPFTADDDIPIFGKGIGAGTQVGNRLLSGWQSFQLGEGEWFRLTAEGGVIFGGLYILWRIAIFLGVLKACLLAFKTGNGIPVIIFSTTAMGLLIGQFGQTTILGFVVLGIGLTVASLRYRPTIKESGTAIHSRNSQETPQ